MLSIIIPTLNEEDYLPLLLDSIAKQNFKDYEIIVADALSTDATLNIARQYNCVVTLGGLPSKGRNSGAKIAKGDLLFFLDADIILKENFLEKSIKEFYLRKLDIASFCLQSYSKKKLSYFLLDVVYNTTIIILEKILPHCAMGVLIKKDLFLEINGYDESIKLSEDHDLGRRAAKRANFGIIRSEKILVSDRRFKRDGWVRTSIKYLLCEIYTVFIGPIRSDIFKYKFNHYKDQKIE